MSAPLLALTGGVGGAKLVLGLYQVLRPEELVCVVNTGDDFEHLGLHISPDLDSLMYALAGENNDETGWGRRAESWQFLDALRQYGGEHWFALGDRDLATHVQRTHLLRQGLSLTAVTDSLCRALGVSCLVLPMSDDPVRTMVSTRDGELAFQHYFVRERCQPEVRGFRFQGIDEARLNPLLLACLSGGIRGILICPSNPYVSIDPILHLRGMMDALGSTGAPIVAVSPIVGGRAIKGPAGKMMRELGKPVDALAVVRHYGDLLDGMVIDVKDAELQAEIEALGVAAVVTQTLMTDLVVSRKLAGTCLALLERLRAPSP